VFALQFHDFGWSARRPLPRRLVSPSLCADPPFRWNHRAGVAATDASDAEVTTEEREPRRDSSAARPLAACIICRTTITSAAHLGSTSVGAMHLRCKGDPDAGTRATANDIRSWWGPEDKRTA
jgi:hypothetical protein